MAYLSHFMISVAMQFTKVTSANNSHQHELVYLSTPLQPPSTSVIFALFVVVFIVLTSLLYFRYSYSGQKGTE